MPYHIRNATPNDIPDLEKLLTEFMQATFQRPWGGTTQNLAQDVSGGWLSYQGKRYVIQ